ncbi:MAG: hypothetical protein J5647_03160 [Spirochaetaceae bacterium]|nr:hypothetical protein [Spirochaetaceae bacterium]
MQYTKIEKIIRDSLLDVRDLYTNKPITSHVIFPKYSDNTERYSEQELKSIFLSKIEQSAFYYSVETPSRNKYRFVENDEPKVSFCGEESKEVFQSSMIDTTLYDSNKTLLSHIEFKYGQSSVFSIQKDFLKLICESQNVKYNYFAHYLGNSDNGTKKAIFSKYRQALNNIMTINTNIDDFERKISKIIIFVMFARLNEIYRFSLKDFAENLNLDAYLETISQPTER